ncbi:TetR/AcrR family transcriptional regulator [Lactiplantibacillus daowaiensis]|uniref:TetR/AcrR family transcriptional regulator n=1 Tax=Lactiplantibacillus daowaiensis TaxID=2559918 RepID=A0ABW1S344_9LACO
MSPQEVKQQNLVAIYQALLQLMTQKPMAAISVTELCQAAKVSRSYFYRHYTTFDQIILAYQEQNMLHYLRQLPNQSQVSLADLMTHYFELTQTEVATTRLLIKNGKLDVLVQTFQTVFKLLIKQNRVSNPRGMHIFEEPYYYEFFSGAVVNVAVNWVQRDMPEPPKYLGQQIDHLAKYH